MKLCLMCGYERPLEDFYRYKAAGYAGGVRYSGFCKTHHKNHVAETRRNAPEGSRTRESLRKANREYLARRRAKEKAAKV